MLKVKFQNTMFYFVYPLGRCEEVKTQNLNHINLLPLITPSPEMPAALTMSPTSCLPISCCYYGGLDNVDGNTSVSSLHSFLKIAYNPLR
jgi:hypothetical protein